MLFDARFRFRVDGSLVDYFAPFEHGEAVGKTKHKGNMLFNDEHGHPLLPACLRKHLRHPIDDRWLKPFGDFIEQQQAGFGDQSPGNNEHLLFAA